MLVLLAADSVLSIVAAVLLGMEIQRRRQEQQRRVSLTDSDAAPSSHLAREAPA